MKSQLRIFFPLVFRASGREEEKKRGRQTETERNINSRETLIGCLLLSLLLGSGVEPAAQVHAVDLESNP